MQDTLESLLFLQKLDNDLLAMEHKQKEIPARISAWDKEYEEEIRRLKELKEELQQTNLNQKTMEKELQEGIEQLKKKEARKLDVKTNEEYRALLKEIEFANQANSEMEDKILMLIDEGERLEQAVKEKEKGIKEKEQQRDQAKSQLQRESVDLDKGQARTEKERQRLSSEISEDTVHRYEKIRSMKSGLAVVVVKDNVCPGCNMHIPPQTVNEVLQTGEIRHCPHCQRILYCVLPDDDV